MDGVPQGPLSSPVNLPDTLHCANISIISDSSCRKDYPGHLMSTMVCAGVEGGGTDSCEVRAKRERVTPPEERKSLGVGPGVGFCLLGAREDTTDGSGVGEGRAVRMGVRLELETVVGLGWPMWWWVWGGQCGGGFGVAWAGVRMPMTGPWVWVWFRFEGGRCRGWGGWAWGSTWVG